jgi:hypothetical protein
MKGEKKMLIIRFPHKKIRPLYFLNFNLEKYSTL